MNGGHRVFRSSPSRATKNATKLHLKKCSYYPRMRTTQLTQKVTEILTRAGKPLSAPEIIDQLTSEHLFPNKTTLYRMLHRLRDEHVVEELTLDSGKAFYEISTDHHHHFCCESCETIECVRDQSLEDSIHAFEKSLASKSFHVRDHQFHFLGLCSKCSNS